MDGRSLRQGCRGSSCGHEQGLDGERHFQPGGGRVGYDPVTGNPRQLSRTVHRGARDAKRALAAFVTEVDSGEAPVDGKVTLQVFLKRWLEHLEPHREAQTIRGYRFKVRKIGAKLGRVQVGKLSAQMLDRTPPDLVEQYDALWPS